MTNSGLDYIPFYIEINSEILTYNGACQSAQSMAILFNIDFKDYVDIMVTRYNGKIYYIADDIHYVYFKNTKDAKLAIEYLQSLKIVDAILE